MIVIDVGCATHGEDTSIPYLIETFGPTFFYGFDPAAESFTGSEGDTVVRIYQAVAWVYDGAVGFKIAGLGGHVEHGATTFPAVDLARFVNELPPDEIVLKIDAEGAEYLLLPHLREHDADLRLKLLWVEWHCEHCGLGGNGRHRENCRGDHAAWEERRAAAEALIRCPLEVWGR